MKRYHSLSEDMLESLDGKFVAHHDLRELLTMSDAEVCDAIDLMAPNPLLAAKSLLKALRTQAGLDAKEGTNG